FSLRKSPTDAKITCFLIKNPTFKQKSRVFYSQIRHFGKHHAFSLCKFPILGNIMRFLFANPPFKRKSRLFENPPLMRKSRVFSSRIPHLSEKQTFSLRKSPI